MPTPTDLLWHVHTYTIPAALALLPGWMTSPAAQALLIAIGLQESGFATRVQYQGPAHGFWQFEKAGGVAGVLTHPSTQPIITPLCDLLLVPSTSAACYAALVHQDVLACCFARLLLWTDPRPLPPATDPAKAWAIYLTQWRPGKPHPETWASHYRRAWHLVDGSPLLDLRTTVEAWAEPRA